MRVAPAFEIFGNQVIKGLFLYLAQVGRPRGPVGTTVRFVKKNEQINRGYDLSSPKSIFVPRFSKATCFWRTVWSTCQDGKVIRKPLLVASRVRAQRKASVLQFRISSTLHLLDYLASHKPRKPVPYGAWCRGLLKLRKWLKKWRFRTSSWPKWNLNRRYLACLLSSSLSSEPAWKLRGASLQKEWSTAANGCLRAFWYEWSAQNCMST